jgi:phosphoserine phosphatase
MQELTEEKGMEILKEYFENDADAQKYLKAFEAGESLVNCLKRISMRRINGVKPKVIAWNFYQVKLISLVQLGFIINIGPNERLIEQKLKSFNSTYFLESGTCNFAFSTIRDSIMAKYFLGEKFTENTTFANQEHVAKTKKNVLDIDPDWHKNAIEDWMKKNKFTEIPYYEGDKPINREAKLQVKRQRQRIKDKD